ncbi:LIM and calponin homology domains-containing protein 1 isoform X10 [Ahaetulla prasina]|uniref:LIM and calponin homology domains-containing protein 1 isoform X10 n=1 Tax=Ahaetulla prasina TaxID=499056 RepID=UPI002648A1D7|nr:LIM and calponin homology domains-containing protein 1 isoform X10 [Ahaetulla prasina]
MPERQPGLQGAAAAAPALLGSPDSASAAADAGGGGGGGGAISARSSCSAAWDALRMASPALAQQPPPQPQPQPALAEARRWIEQVTGKTFGDKHFRSGLENGVLLCELLNSILPGSVTKINRSSTPIAGLDNIALFLRGCREVGLKESQLFDPGDLQETTGRTTTKNLDGSRKLKNVLVTIYWLGKTANNSAHFNGPPLNLKEFEGLLTQMRKDTEDVESPKRSIRDSGYVDCWDSERSDSLSPPRHGRDDSFDSLDSFGSRSQQTPSPDVVLRGSSDGRGSDSESDLPHRKLPDVKKDDMSARRTSYSEPKSVVPFNQYLPNKSNQTAYIPAPLRKKKAEREDFRKSWSTMSSPLGGERPFSKQHPETIEEEPLVPLDGDLASSRMTSSCPSAKPMRTDMGPKNPWPQFLTCSENQTIAPQNEEKGPEEIGKLRRLEQAGIKVRPAAQRCGGSPKPASQGDELTPDIVLHQENPFMWWRPQNDTGSEEDEDGRIPDLEKDDFAVRRARLNRREAALPFTHFFLPPSAKKDRNRREERKIHTKNQERPSGKKILVTSAKPEMPGEDQPSWQDEGKAQIPDIQSHGLAKKPTHARPSQAAFLSCGKASITPKDKEIWDRLKVSGETRSGCRTPVSDDTESVSMFDMRCPDEGAVNQPHSKDRHEKLQIVHHQLKEDEDQWQDDLARWKNRRRSASQDLLKKEAERKKMEQLLIGGEGSNERRKSIKTYREIVEEKEKRERELHEAYKNARSQEEADRILQHYIERFTISEAVLERLEMPKLLERSHSVEPNSSSPSKDPNPLRYLRQQSLPPPKFTAKFEATIIPTNGSEASTSTGSPTSSRPSGSMAMPLVTPKPYSQPRETREILRNFKVDGKISVNGEASNGVDDEPDKDCSAFLFEPSPTLSTKSDHVVKSHGGSTEGSTNSTTPEPVQKSLIEHAVHREKVDSFTEEVDTACRKDRTELKEKFLVDPDLMEPSVTFSCANLLAADVEISSFHNHSNETESHPELNSTQEAKALERGEEKEKDASVSQKVQIDTSQAPKPGEDLPISLLKKLPETNHGVLLETPLQDQKAAAENRDASNRSTCWSWDPEEERRRQERWQQEQERLLQEKYQKEQEKLKKEWEKAQKEVEEEERKYYEEERKILEDTVVPFMLASGSTEPLSTSSSLTDGNRTMNLIDLSYSEDDKKPNEEAKLKSLFYEQDGANYKECQPREENTSTVNKEEYPEGLNWRQKEQVPTPGDKSPKDMALPLRPEVLWNQPLPADRSPGISDIRQKDSPVGYNLGQPASSPKEVKRAASQGSSGTGPSSPRSPTVQSQSSNRSISGKKLCSSCGLPLGKGAAMIIESLGLYFHIQCFRVGVSRPGGGLD